MGWVHRDGWIALTQVLSQGDFLSRRTLGKSGNILILTTGEDATSIYWVDTREAAKHCTMHRIVPPPSPPQRIIRPKMSIVQRLEN